MMTLQLPTRTCPSKKITYNDMNSRCAVRIVHDVISSFDEMKASMVKSIGFGGLLPS
jgi:hypothetical protein